MSKKPKAPKPFHKSLLRFKQSELERALRGVRKMGFAVERIEVDGATGKFTIGPKETTNEQVP